MGLINYLTAIQFEDGAVSCLPDEMAALGMRRPLIVTDAGIRAAGLLDRVLEHISVEVVVFDETPTNPTEAAVSAACKAYADGGCDSLIAIGGGSPIDLAKGVRLMATHDGPLEQYAAILGGLPKITDAVAPLIAVPTTAGTGSEVGRAALLTLNDGRKLGFISPHMIPNRAICDPELTAGMPAGLTAATGMDALCHGIETYLSTTYNPPAQAIARDCVIRCARWLKIAADEPGNREARSEMMMAALEGGLSLQKGLGAIHAATLPLGALGLHHGELNAIVMPMVIEFNRAYVADKIVALEQAAGLSEKLEDWCASLTEYLDLPTRLSQLGVTEEQLPKMAQEAVGEHLNQTNPKPLDAEEMLAILRKAL